MPFSIEVHRDPARGPERMPSLIVEERLREQEAKGVRMPPGMPLRSLTTSEALLCCINFIHEEAVADDG
jgi:hypothetical protein